MSPTTRPISLAIAALGGQGGGVLSDWIVAVAEDNGYLAQATSVPGVAQRTGATIYYIELYPRAEAEARGRDPVLALYPVPGDVDIVMASELIEAGRSILRGLVTPELTTLITSSHRVYAIGERTALGNGMVNHEAVLAAGQRSAKRFVCVDMAAAAERTGSMISAVLLGALAGSAALPFERETYLEVIRAGGKAVESNLAGFAEGYSLARGDSTAAAAVTTEPAAAATANGRAAELRARIDEFPAACRAMVLEGARRTADFQDLRYAALYLQRLDAIVKLDREYGGEPEGWRLSCETARYLALRMSYEDTYRVADLKTRSSRFRRFRAEVRAEPGQLINVVEFMHPRIEEICDTLPAWLGRFVMNSPRLRRLLAALTNRGRKVKTTHLSGFLPLYLLARLKRLRRISLRFGIEQQRIHSWLDDIAAKAPANYAVAVEIAECARLLKGYGDTYERGLRSYNEIMTAAARLPACDESARLLGRLQSAALADEDGAALAEALRQVA